MKILAPMYPKWELPNFHSAFMAKLHREGVIQIEVYTVFFITTILIYFIPYIVGVAIVMTRINVYSSNVKRGFDGARSLTSARN